MLRELFVTRYSRLSSDKAFYEPDMELISDMVHPIGMIRDSANVKENERTKRSQIVDNIAERAVDDLSAYLTSLIAPPDARWFMLADEEPSTIDDIEKKGQLDAASRKALAYLNQPERNFHLSFDESAVECVPFGLGIMHVQELKEGLYFSSVSIKEVYVQENFKGEIDAVIRRRKMTAMQILGEYVDVEKPTYDLSENEIADIRQQADSDPNYEYDILYGVFPENDSITKAAGTPYKYSSVHCFYNSVGNKYGILRKGGLKRFPYFAYRFRRRAGEPYGHGCGHRGLSDIRVLQGLKKDNIIVSKLTGRPPLHVPHQAYTKALNVSPGATNHGKRTSRTGNEKAEPLFLVGSLPVSVEMSDRIRVAIEEAFYLDAIKETKNNEMSATESNIRRQDRFSTLNPTIKRIMKECTTAVIEYVVDYLKEKGKLNELQGIDNISVVYINYILKSQFDTELLGLERLTSTILNLSKAFPDLPMSFDEEQIVPMLIEKTFLPYKLKRKSEDVKKDKEIKQMQAATQIGTEQSQSTLNYAKAAETLGL